MLRNFPGQEVERSDGRHARGAPRRKRLSVPGRDPKRRWTRLILTRPEEEQSHALAIMGVAGLGWAVGDRL
jgi:hypothetical protein